MIDCSLNHSTKGLHHNYKKKWGKIVPLPNPSRTIEKTSWQTIDQDRKRGRRYATSDPRGRSDNLFKNYTLPKVKFAHHSPETLGFQTQIQHTSPNSCMTQGFRRLHSNSTALHFNNEIFICFFFFNFFVTCL
jgi:hypothetical protein